MTMTTAYAIYPHVTLCATITAILDMHEKDKFGKERLVDIQYFKQVLVYYV
jgi:hypothetical protein